MHAIDNEIKLTWQASDASFLDGALNRREREDLKSERKE